MSTHLLLAGARQSRFVSRWLAADPDREAVLAQLSGLSLAELDLDQLLRQALATGSSDGMPVGAALRRMRGLLFAAIVERDVTGRADLDEVLAAISRFADFAVRKALADQYAALCGLHGVPIGEESGRPQQMIVVGMGKLGGHELNVSSDIDLIFLYPEGGETRTERDDQRPLSNHEFFVRLGKRLIAQLAEITEDGYCFRVDMALRPNGASGPLAASFAMLEEYLLVQGREWERYAWVKARAMTGDADDIAYLDKLVQPFVYRRYLDYGVIHALRNMHAQIRAEVLRQETRHPGRAWNVKLGRGGIREVEFIAQVFQLIRGGRDPSLRDRSTRDTLNTIAAKKLMAPDTVARLLDAYAFLRNIEHRIQYLDDAQSHVLPPSDEEQQRIAVMAGFDDTDALKLAITECCAWVAAQFDAIFEDKSAPASDDASSAQPPVLEDIDETALAQYLDTLGYDDAPAAAGRLLSSWRSSRIQAMPPERKQQLQVLMRNALQEIARQQGSCAQTLNRVVDFFEAIARRSAYLSLLTEFPQALERVVRMMAASDWAARYLTRHPVLMDELLDDSSLHAEPDWKAFGHECRQRLAAFAGDTERQMDVLRELHHAHLFRLLAQDLGGVLTVERLADHLSALADVLVGATLSAVWQTIPNRHRETPAFSVIAYGKLGGKELGYASDLDVIFLYDDEDPEAPALYAKLAQRFITWMTSHTPAGILFDIDIALRPDGASGLLVSSLASFEKYQRNSAWVWEHQALTRARFCAGDQEIGRRFEKLRIDLLRQPRDADALRREVLTMRQRMHDAHPNRSGQFDLKHDPGGMIDIEFVVQYLVLAHACDFVALTGDIGNIALLKLAGQIGLIDGALALQVADAYRSFRKLQHQIRLRGEDRARVEPAQVEAEANAVKKLWEMVLG
ncbi:MAG: bifunctional [glutamate--ammonia ligase]-adenylyl-L-tyrosine [Pseudomonadota bacterium]